TCSGPLLPGVTRPRPPRTRPRAAHRSNSAVPHGPGHDTTGCDAEVAGSAEWVRRCGRLPEAAMAERNGTAAVPYLQIVLAGEQCQGGQYRAARRGCLPSAIVR